ncbi:uncharacterized protein [Periplaneta americana]|uniref:uncharacterized protein isoform X2 n=1 Tax=Periplaneta americana TaxID=6978 RepID=UPI0037E79C3F
MNTPPQEPQNRRTTRSALSEIPTRLGMLSVSDNTRLTPVTALVPNSNPVGLWNISVNLPSSYVSPSPSPDEMIIQQRGRRRVPATWSPDIDQDKQNGPTRDRTPVKASPLKSTIVLRSTPRKRLLLNDPKELFPTPEKTRKMSPNSKKSRVEKPSSHSVGPLQATLKGLSQDQLIDVIQGLVGKHPDLEDKCVLEQGRQLVESQHWESVLEYVFLAWSYVRATPLWDNPPHNTARRQCFKSLAAQCMTALKKGMWTNEQCESFQEKLESCLEDNEDIQACLKHLDILRNKC